METIMVATKFICLFLLFSVSHAAFSASSKHYRGKQQSDSHWRYIDKNDNYFKSSHNSVWHMWRHTRNDAFEKKLLSESPSTLLVDPQEFSGGLLIANITSHLDPTLKIELAQPRCVRLSSSSDGPFMWYRVEEGWYGCHYIRREPSRSLNVLPHIKSREIEEYREFKASIESLSTHHKTTLLETSTTPKAIFYDFWAKRFAAALSSCEAAMSPLNQGLWRLEPLILNTNTVHEIVRQRFHSGQADFDHRSIQAFSLRPFKSSGRVKWWRKKAQEGLLPPVFLWWCSGLDSHVVLDGHDRLLAASLEKQPIDVIRLVRRTPITRDAEERKRVEEEVDDLLDWDVRTSDKEKALKVEMANRLLVEAYSTQLQDADSNNMVQSRLSTDQWREQVAQQIMQSHSGGVINADSYSKLFDTYGTKDDNDFWESLLEEVPHKFLQTWKG